MLYLLWYFYYLRRRLASEGIVTLGVTLSRCVYVRRAAYITYRLHAALVSAAKVMRCIQCCLVVVRTTVGMTLRCFRLHPFLSFQAQSARTSRVAFTDYSTIYRYSYSYSYRVTLLNEMFSEESCSVIGLSEKMGFQLLWSELSATVVRWAECVPDDMEKLRTFKFISSQHGHKIVNSYHCVRLIACRRHELAGGRRFDEIAFPVRIC